VETDTLQGADQTKATISPTNSDGASREVSKSSEQTLALITASAPSLPTLSEDGSAVADTSRLRVTKILDE
jgi:hypothetical protein